MGSGAERLQTLENLKAGPSDGSAYRAMKKAPKPQKKVHPACEPLGSGAGAALGPFGGFIWNAVKESRRFPQTESDVE